MTALDSAAPPMGRRAFALLGTVQVTLIYTLAAIAVPLPRIGLAFGLGRERLVVLSAAYGLAFAGLLLLGGRLADRYGGRRTLLAGLLLFAVAGAAAPLAPGYGALVAARFAQGAGAALTAPAATAVLRALAGSPAAYGRAMATWGGLSVLGATAGNLLSGVVAALLSWRWALAVPVALAALALPAALRLLPRDPVRPRGTPLDAPGAVLATAGITAASLGLVRTDARPWGSADVLVPLLAGAVLLAVFPAAERRAADPLLPPGFLRDGRRALGLAATALTASGTATTFLLFSLHFQDERGWSALTTSAAFAPFAAVLVAAGRVAPNLVRRHGPLAVTGAGLAGVAAGLALLALAGLDPAVPYGYGVLPGFLLLPAGAALAFAGAAVLATDRVPAHRTGLAGGVHNTAMETGPTVVLAVLLAVGDDAASLGTAAALCAAAAVPLLLDRR
ncbi:MFS transporter [Streptomyces sp. Ru71]|uniref:MFS transporter n=1 Tax=Streptomyces sp. Ru71 TaxID=2080746 RepID=UPI000CDD096C|nr:MFS transporter [Streptomyces sp. Ru71]POX50408.1 MFS transporter [Streptomyces sp. Ru71]